MSVDYNRVERDLYKTFKKYGTPMYFYHDIDGEKNDVTGATDYSELVTEVYGMTSNFGDIFIDGSMIQKGDKQLIITSRAGRPSLGDEVKIEDTYYKVINVKEMRPSDRTLIYEVHVRSYAVGEDIDRLFIDLKDLQLGSLISDPNRQNTPVWRVIAHNHHRNGLTTLITDKVWDLVSFNGTVEIGANYPSDPWTDTFMRQWLHHEFSKVLSAKMVGNLTGAIVKTNNENITDTITLLSVAELTGVKTPGQNNGEHIKYFEADSLRIAYYNDPNRKTNKSTEYWTRDAKGIGADGKVVIYNPRYTHGVRPVIFLNGGLETALNFNGEYEVQFE